MQEISSALQSGNAKLRAEFARLVAEEKIALWGEFMTDEERRAFLADAQNPTGADFNFQWYGRRIEVDVVERFWGDVDETVVVQTGFGGGDCGVAFKEGEEYLIRSAAGKNGLYATGICGKTGHVRFHQDTLASLRAWRKGEPRPRIVSGVVQDWTSRENRHARGGYPPMEGVDVFLRGEGTELKATTDADGAFRFENVPQEVFQVDPDVPGYGPTSVSDHRDPLDMISNSCSSLFITLKQNQAVIRGRVLPQPGEELPRNLWIEAIPADPNSAAPFDATADKENGRFSIDEIEPGRFHVAINVENAPTGPHGRTKGRDKIWPYRSTYYPGVSDPAKAAVFEVQRGMVVDVGNWTLPARLREVMIPGQVVLPDGTPASDARLILRRPSRDESLSKFGPTDGEGRFEAYLLESIEYEVEALAEVDRAVYRGSVLLGVERPDELWIELEPSEARPSDAHLFGLGRGR